MGLDLNSEYVNTTAADADYPVGSFKNVSVPAGSDGTPLEKAWCNDIYGLLQRLILEAGITVSGAPDTVQASDYYDALIELFHMKYDTVADMIAADLQVGSIVKTRGYLTAGDTGNATYMIVAPATGTDDGGSFIDLTPSPNNQAQLIPDGPVRSKQFGAVGNAIVDDTTAIQNLIDAFGNICIDTNSLVTGLTLNSNMNINIIETLVITNGDLFTATSKNQINITFSVDGVLSGDDSTSDIGILFDGCTNINIYNPIITQFTDSGITIQNGCTSCNIYGGSIVDCEAGIIVEDATTLYNNIRDTYLNLCNYGLKVIGASKSNFDNLSCIANVNAGILLQDKTGGCKENEFSGCKCNDGTGAGATDGGFVINPINTTNVPFDNIIIGLICNNNTSHGINITPAPGGLGCEQVKFIAPICRDNTLSGIYIEEGRQVEITNGTCIGNTQHGIDVQDGFDFKLNGGDYRNNDIDGIHYQTAQSTTIGVSASDNGRYGLSTSDGPGSVISHRISYCTFFNNTTEEVSFTGNSGAVTKAFNCVGDYTTDNRQVTSAQDGDIIGHVLTPQTGFTLANMIIIATASTQGHIVTVRDKTATTFTIDVVDDSGTPTASDEDINWEAHLY